MIFVIVLGPNGNKIEIDPIKVNNDNMLQHEHAIVDLGKNPPLIKLNNPQTNEQLLPGPQQKSLLLIQQLTK